MRIIGIDPGLNKLGYAVIEKEKEKIKVIITGFLIPPKKLKFEEKLEYIYHKIESIFQKFSPEFVIIEEIYLGKSFKVSLKIGKVIGIIISSAIGNKAKFAFITPREIKKNLVGTGLATKEQVKFMVEKLTGYDNIKNLDESDALAVALCFPNITSTWPLE